MKIVQYFVWIFAGAGIGIANFFTQYLSVKAIQPEKAKQSKCLILGGAVLRWSLVGYIFFISISSSMIALLIVFFSFMVVRLVTLYTFSTRWQIVQNQTD